MCTTARAVWRCMHCRMPSAKIGSTQLCATSSPASDSVRDHFPMSSGSDRTSSGCCRRRASELITDLFEKIVLYDLQVSAASVEQTDSGYDIEMTVEARKFEADGAGAGNRSASDVQMLELAVFPEKSGRAGRRRSAGTSAAGAGNDPQWRADLPIHAYPSCRSGSAWTRM